MRLGIFSDVHANLEALNAVVEAYKLESIDRYYCLGDVVGYGANPNECTNIVRNVAELTILGNHDAAVAGRMDYSYYYEAARQALDAHAQSLTADNMAWLKGLPYKHRLADVGVLLCHGSPVRIEEFEYIFAPEQARECLPILDQLGDITLIGHSHLCKVFALKPGEVRELPAKNFQLQEGYKYIVSVGSVTVSRATLRQPRARATPCSTPPRAPSSSPARRVRHRSGGHEDLRPPSWSATSGTACSSACEARFSLQRTSTNVKSPSSGGWPSA